MVISPRSASRPPRPNTMTSPSDGSAASGGASRAVSRAARSRSPNSRSARRRSSVTSRISCPKPLTTRTPVTVSSTCWAMSAARCWADQVAGNSPWRVRVVSSTETGTMIRATTVSSGDNHNIAATEATSSTRYPVTNGTIDSSPCTCCRSLIARETTWPVRRLSCLGPSRRCTEANTARRRSCWTSSASRPPR
jgi:hypothetical protein